MEAEMNDDSKKTVLENIRSSLERRPEDRIPPRPAILDPRRPGSQQEELDLLLAEIEKLSGVVRRVSPEQVDEALVSLVKEMEVKKATLWPTSGLAQLRLEGRLRSLGVEIISPCADKHEMALCDLGVTEVDFALPETGTLALLSSAQKPRAVSLLPRVHLAVLKPGALRADLHQVFAEVKDHHYLIFITGPSRTADIELTVALGVHGPKNLYVWALP
jgi:L-lactate dehydrogenase complex protein LldG